MTIYGARMFAPAMEPRMYFRRKTSETMVAIAHIGRGLPPDLRTGSGRPGSVALGEVGQFQLPDRLKVGQISPKSPCDQLLTKTHCSSRVKKCTNN